MSRPMNKQSIMRISLCLLILLLLCACYQQAQTQAPDEMLSETENGEASLPHELSDASGDQSKMQEDFAIGDMEEIGYTRSEISIKAMDCVSMYVPELISYANYIAEKSEGRATHTMMAFPDLSDIYHGENGDVLHGRYYQVYVGEQWEDHRVNWDWFSVSEDFTDVFWFNSIEQEIMSLDEWRESDHYKREIVLEFSSGHREPDLDSDATMGGGEIVPLLPYIPKETVPISDFDFDGNVLLVKDRSWEFYRDTWGEDPTDVVDYPIKEEYALLGEGVMDIRLGRTYYDSLNAPYYTTFVSPDAPFLEKTDALEMIRAYYSRNVVFLSGEGERVLCLSPGEYKEYEGGYYDSFSARRRARLYEIFDGEGQVFSVVTQSAHDANYFHPLRSLSAYVYFYYDDEEDINLRDVYFNWEQGIEEKLPRRELSNYCSPSPDGESYAIFDTREEPPLVTLYTLPDFRLMQTIEMNPPYPMVKHDYRSHYGGIQLLDDDRLVFTKEMLGEVVDTARIEHTFVYATFILDLRTHELTRVGEYFFRQLFSPDGRYVAYTAPNSLERVSGVLEDSAIAQNAPYGYYIYDLHTDKTVFYETESAYSEIVCWSKRGGIDSLISAMQ